MMKSNMNMNMNMNMIVGGRLNGGQWCYADLIKLSLS